MEFAKSHLRKRGQTGALWGHRMKSFPCTSLLFNTGSGVKNLRRNLVQKPLPFPFSDGFLAILQQKEALTQNGVMMV